MPQEKRRRNSIEAEAKRIKAQDDGSDSGNDGIAIDNELLQQSAKGTPIGGNSTFHQLLLNNELPQTSQILQDRINSPSAQEFKAQLAKTAAAATGTGPDSPVGGYSHATVAAAAAAAAAATGLTSEPSQPPIPRPSPGSDEWHKMRRDNHKEVERRRRETINKGIEKIAQIVPDCDKQKSQILKRAFEYIEKLKNNETSNLEKYGLEKLLREQAIEELSQRNKKLTEEVKQAWRETEQWKKAAMDRGVTSIEISK